MFEALKNRKVLMNNRSLNKANQNKPSIPEGLYNKCSACHSSIHKDDLSKNQFVCSQCNHHFKISANNRIGLIADPHSFKEYYKYLKTVNVLDFKGYDEKINNLVMKNNINEAVVTGLCRIDGVRCMVAVMDSFFLMGSMGSVVGEKITRTIEKATSLKLPLIIFSTSGGARMQEGIHSLMQMAKTSAALAKHQEAGLLYISVLTHPTTGGVTASYAMLGDIILAEPQALIGFAGPRVIEQTIHQSLPEGFQRSEFLLEKGFVDAVVDRRNMKATLSKLLKLHRGVK